MAFVTLELAAIPLLLYLGRHRWFQFDEWDFLASREATNLRDLFEPHSVHWSTVPILVYRVMWKLFGIHSYVPYQALSVASHLAVVALVRVVMRRAGVGPWVATIAASVLLFLGSGEQNILWAFNITFNGSLILGLAHLVLADHDGGLQRRDLVGLACGLVGLTFSGVSVTLVVVVGLAVLLRRGIRPAAFHTVPLVVVYGLWFVAFGREAYGAQSTGSGGEIARFLGDLVQAAVRGLAQVHVLGVVLAVGWLVGLVVLWRVSSPSGRRQLAAPVALAVGSFAFLVVTAVGRADLGIQAETSNRYVYVSIALALPSFVLVADAVAARWSASIPVVAAIVVVSLVGNLLDFREDAAAALEFRRAQRDALLTLPRLPIADDVPRRLHPDRLAPWVSYGWLLDGVTSGRIPEPPPAEPEWIAAVEGRLVLRPDFVHPRRACDTVPVPADLTLARGAALVPLGRVEIAYTDALGRTSLPIFYEPTADIPYIVAYAGPLDVRVVAVGGNDSVEVCDRDGAPLTVRSGP